MNPQRAVEKILGLLAGKMSKMSKMWKILKAVADYLKRHFFSLIFISIFAISFIVSYNYVKTHYSLSIDEDAFGPLDDTPVGHLGRLVKETILEGVAKAGGDEEQLHLVENLLNILFSPFKIRVSRDNEI